MSDITYYTVRMDTRQPTAYVLAPGGTRPEKLEHFFDAKDIHKHMQENFGPDVKQLPASKFREEVERRRDGPAVALRDDQEHLVAHSLGEHAEERGRLLVLNDVGAAHLLDRAKSHGAVGPRAGRHDGDRPILVGGRDRLEQQIGRRSHEVDQLGL